MSTRMTISLLLAMSRPARTDTFKWTRDVGMKNLQERTDRFNAAVKALVGDSPAWKPAMKDGRTVPVVVVYPVNCFTLIR